MIMTAPTLTRIHHLGLTVRDAGASARWYEKVLGFTRSGDFVSADESRRKVFVEQPSLGVRIGLCQHAAASGAEFSELNPGLDHLAFGVDSVADLEACAARLAQHGVTYSPIADANTIPGAKVLVFRDPDHIQLELIATPGI